MNENEKYELDAIYQRNSLEWFALLRKFKDDEKYKEGRELLDWKRQEIDELIELLNKHKRELNWRAGEKLDPVMHFGSAVLEGKLGGQA